LLWCWVSEFSGVRVPPRLRALKWIKFFWGPPRTLERLPSRLRTFTQSPWASARSEFQFRIQLPGRAIQTRFNTKEALGTKSRRFNLEEKEKKELHC
jgi:hypothetical protein